MSTTQEYIDQYAQYAMEQMERYGIPASITLAQAILESDKGRSRLSRQENNHFGIKATRAWLDNGGDYGVYKDDKPNEKFCAYESVRDSFEHHSRFIVDNSRYKDCLSLAVNDYRGWAQGLQKAGYATSQTYSKSLISIIESNDLQKYDQMVISSPGHYATEYQANLPDRAKVNTYRGLNRENVADSNALTDANTQSLEPKKDQIDPQQEPQKSQSKEGEDFDSWMKKLVATSEDEDKSQSSGMDPITNMVITMFTSLFAIAAMIDNKTPLEQSAQARRAINTQEIDFMPIIKEQSTKGEVVGLNTSAANADVVNTGAVKDIQNSNSTKTPLTEGKLQTQSDNPTLEGRIKVEDIRACKFQVTEQSKATIVIEDSLGKTHSYDVSAKELSNLQSTLNTPGISAQQKSMAVVAFISTSMARTIDRENNHPRTNANAMDQANNNSNTTKPVLTNSRSDSTPSLADIKTPNHTPTITVSTAAQMASRNYEIAEMQSQIREGQSYSR